MPIGYANAVNGVGCYSKPVLRKVRFAGNGATDGALTLTAGECDAGYSVVASASGLTITVTGPRCRKATVLYANGVTQATATATLMHELKQVSQDTTNASGAQYVFKPFDIAGTLEVLVANDIYEIGILVDEGSS